MAVEKRLLVGREIAKIAIKNGFIGMNLPEMFDHAAVSTELSFAQSAFILHFAGVNVHVRCQRLLRHEFLAAVGTGFFHLIAFLSAVSGDVKMEILFDQKDLIKYLTSVG